MRVCGIADAWIFCGFSRDAWIYPWMRPYPTNKAKAKKGPLRRIRWDERPGVRISFCAHETTHPRHPGDIGDIGDISRKPLKLPDFLKAPGGDISGDIFLGGDFTRKMPLRVRRTGLFDAPKTGPRGRIRWEERPETPENDRIAHLRARHPMRVRFLASRCYRGTPIDKTPREVGVRNGWHPSW